MRLVNIEPLIDECDELVSIEWNHKVAPPSWADAEEEFKQRLLDQPVIDPESLRPQGKWIAQDIGRTKFSCSHCKARNYGGYENYCPNCGAGMKRRGDHA